MTTVLVTETCACGTEVERKIFAADTEPRITATQAVWCPSCGLEVRDCKAAGCLQKAIGYTGTFDRPFDVCRYHAYLLETHGGNPVTYRGAAKGRSS